MRFLVEEVSSGATATVPDVDNVDQAVVVAAQLFGRSYKDPLLKPTYNVYALRFLETRGIEACAP